MSLVPAHKLLPPQQRVRNIKQQRRTDNPPSTRLANMQRRSQHHHRNQSNIGRGDQAQVITMRGPNQPQTHGKEAGHHHDAGDEQADPAALGHTRLSTSLNRPGPGAPRQRHRQDRLRAPKRQRPIHEAPAVQQQKIAQQRETQSTRNERRCPGRMRTRQARQHHARRQQRGNRRLRDPTPRALGARSQNPVRDRGNPGKDQTHYGDNRHGNSS